jgi:phosphatidate cytidylyltransferase
VAVENPTPTPAPAKGARSELMLRILSAAVLAPLAVLTAYLGGWPFVIFWTLAACGIMWEWRKIVAQPGDMFGIAGEFTIALAGACTLLGLGASMLPFIGLGAVVVGIGARTNPLRLWVAAGVLYAGALLFACVSLRADPGHGFVAIIFLFGVVWATDILGYFVGRFVGGPKLWPRVSPKKTWSGAIGGALGAIVAGLAVARYAHLTNSLAIIRLALLLSAVSQAGDLFESAFKRRFGVKDAGHVIPGHGGLMDRLDGFVAAALVAVMIGITRGDFSAPARGLLVW